MSESSPFEALSDPTRRAILNALADGPRTAGEVATAVELSPSSTSYHLDLLRRAELVTSEKDGRFVRYALATTAVEEAAQWLLTLLGVGEARTDPSAEAQRNP